MNPFYKQVYDLVRTIPQGKVMSYGQIAKNLGRPRSAREVGRAMRVCSVDNVPWQRVVMFDGRIAGGVHAPVRKAMLEAEGVQFLPDGRVDMKVCQVI
ncbi:MAG: MGMT family protein [Defluviitaleaceae bacterium]|nr:MGMT family protein [Defluviitaleaceae bacterium]